MTRGERRRAARQVHAATVRNIRVRCTCDGCGNVVECDMPETVKCDCCDERKPILEQIFECGVCENEMRAEAVT